MKTIKKYFNYKNNDRSLNFQGLIYHKRADPPLIASSGKENAA